MHSHLPNLPVELTELITRDLNLSALRSLRFVCRALCNSVTGSKRFTDSLQHQRRRLIECDLQMLLALAKHETLSQYVTALTLIIPVYNGGTLRKMIETRKQVTDVEMINHRPVQRSVDCDEEMLEQARIDLQWMTSQNVAHGADIHTEILTKILRGIPTLRSLKIEAAMLSSPSLSSENDPGNEHTSAWEARWLFVAHGCGTVLAAVAQAEPDLRELNILPSTKSRSLTLPAMRWLVPLLEERDFRIVSARRIKTLSLCVASDLRRELREPLIPPPPKDDGYYTSLQSCRWAQSESSGTRYELEMMRATARFIVKMPGLEALDLYFGDPASGSTLRNHFQVFAHIAADVVLPSLQRFVLRGFTVTSHTLLKFLRNHPMLTHIEFHNIRLSDGNWQPIFDHICTMPHLQHLLLDSIWSGKLEHLGMIGDGEENWVVKHHWFPHRGGGVTRFLHTRHFTRAQLQQGLHFIPCTQGRSLGSPQARTWSDSTRKEYRAR